MSRQRTGGLDERMERLMLRAEGFAEGFPESDYGKLDRATIPEWANRLRASEASIRHFRRRLEAVLTEDGRRCLVCDKAVTGRPDQVYCGGTCRQRAYRSPRR